MSKIERRSYLKQVGALSAASTLFAGQASADGASHENEVRVFAKGDGEYRIETAQSAMQTGKETAPSAAVDGNASAAVESGDANFFRSASPVMRLVADAPLRMYAYGEYSTDTAGTVTVSGTGSYFFSTTGDRAPEATTLSTGSAETGSDPGKVFASGELTDGEHVFEVAGDLTAVWVEETASSDPITVTSQRR